MTNRPPEFDAKVMAYMPMLRKMSTKLAPPDQRKDLVQDALLHIFEKWENFRGDPSEPKSGFHNWLWWQMRAVAANKRSRKTLPMVYVDSHEKYAHLITTPAPQEAAAVATDMLRQLNGRDGKVLLKRACGYSLKEIANDMGLTKERVRQLEGRERGRMKKVAA